jgi:hypothetical protein
MKEKTQAGIFLFVFDIKILLTARMSVHSGPVIISAATGSQQYRYPFS